MRRRAWPSHCIVSDVGARTNDRVGQPADGPGSLGCLVNAAQCVCWQMASVAWPMSSVGEWTGETWVLGQRGSARMLTGSALLSASADGGRQEFGASKGTHQARRELRVCHSGDYRRHACNPPILPSLPPLPTSPAIDAAHVMLSTQGMPSLPCQFRTYNGTEAPINKAGSVYEQGAGGMNDAGCVGVIVRW